MDGVLDAFYDQACCARAKPFAIEGEGASTGIAKVTFAIMQNKLFEGQKIREYKQ